MADTTFQPASEAPKVETRPARRPLLGVHDAVQRLQVRVTDHLRELVGAQVLEAGCGSSTYFSMPADAHIVGIDISQEQLDRHARLDVRICGDLETHQWDTGSFDFMVCWYVMEHLSDPVAALTRMADGLRPGGLIVMAMPRLYSFKGMVTKFTPHWFHVLVYKRVLGRHDADRPDRPPFPSFLRRAIHPTAIKRVAADLGLDVDLLVRFEDYTQAKLRAERRLADTAYRVIDAVAAVCTGGRANMYESDYAIVLRKAPVADEEPIRTET